MPRLLFEKTGNAVWMSHLDLMRLFQRAFKRAGLPLKHTQGFNPRPSVAIALPMSVGVESCCELLDFELEGEGFDVAMIADKLNTTLVEGVRVLESYPGGRKTRDIALLRCRLTLTYDAGVPQGYVDAMDALFARDALPVEKHGKNGPVEQNILPLIRSISFTPENDRFVVVEALVCCQEPSLNPMQIPAAITRHLPEFAPDHAVCRRLEIYDGAETIFR